MAYPEIGVSSREWMGLIFQGRLPQRRKCVGGTKIAMRLLLDSVRRWAGPPPGWAGPRPSSRSFIGSPVPNFRKPIWTGDVTWGYRKCAEKGGDCRNLGVARVGRAGVGVRWVREVAGTWRIVFRRISQSLSFYDIFFLLPFPPD